MLVLGIDPGSTATGWAVLRRQAGRTLLVDSGVIRTLSADPVPDRLLRIHQGLADVLARHLPEEVAIEAIFRHKSSESALRLGQARGVALLAVAQAGLPAHEYNPMTIKKTVGGHGGAGKPELQRLLCRLLGLDAPLPADASDAAAVAMTHLGHAGIRRAVAR
jgi:crossover junction endodeoxyribonuclease RuvC